MSENNYAQLLINTIPICCYCWDEDFNRLAYNDEVIRLFLLEEKEDFKEKFWNLSPESQPDGQLSIDKMHKMVKIAFDAGYCHFEWMHQTLTGIPIPCEITLVLTEHNNRPVVAGYTRDLSEHVAMEKEKQKAELAEENIKIKNRFLAAMSHEIRTPMNAILGITEIQLQSENLPEPIKDAFNRIYTSGDMLMGIVNDLLDLSKIEAGKLEITPKAYEIANLIKDTVDLNMMRLDNKRIEFILEVDADIPGILIGDELRIKQILNNLLSNAFKYTSHGIVKLGVQTEKLERDDEIIIVFSVSDTGQGMTQEQIDKIFEEYSRFNIDVNCTTVGTGLGMGIAHNLIKLMNGNIAIDSYFDKGTDIKVRLPQGITGADTIGVERANSLQALLFDTGKRSNRDQKYTESMPYGRILIVDDVDTNLYVAKSMLIAYDLQVDTVESGFGAIELIRKGHEYDIIFMDHMMPKLDGIETTQRLRKMNYKKPIVALTANAIIGQSELFYSNGFDGFITKPIDRRQLNNVLMKFVRDKKPLKTNYKHKDKKKQQEIDPILARAFIKDAQKAIVVLEKTYNMSIEYSKDKLEQYIIAVHAMKSALASIGEKKLSSFAFILEKAGDLRKTELLFSETPLFINELHLIISKLIPMAEQITHEMVLADNKIIVDKLPIFIQACAEYEKKTAKDIVLELQQYKLPVETEKQLVKITALLIHSEFEKASEIAKVILKQHNA